MTTEETAKVMEYIKTCYPFAWKQVDAKKTVAVWADQFSEEPRPLVMAAVKAYVSTNATDYPPNIGQIKAMIHKLSAGDELTASDAWTHIRKAISNSGYHAAEEFENLSDTEKRLVGSPKQLYDWAMMDVGTLDSVVASNVQRSFRSVTEKVRFEAALPQTVKALTQRLFLQGATNEQI